MTAPFLFLHGWGLDASLWDGMRAILGEQAGAAGDLGYFGAAGTIAGNNRPVIAVGHSLGVMQLLLDPPPGGLAGLVAINGFTRFSAAVDHPGGVAIRILRRMMQRLDAETEATVRDFRARCGLDGLLPGRPVLAPLQRGLALLCEGDARPAWRALSCPVLVLAGDADPIAPPVLSAACFDVPCWVEGGGHLLPLTHSALCAQALRSFAETLL